MSFKEKYLIYKKKYFDLKTQRQLIFNVKNLAIDTGLSNIVDIQSSPSCSKNIPLYSNNNILDLDCLKLSLDENKLLSKELIDSIKNVLPKYYDEFYEYLWRPKAFGNELGFTYYKSGSVYTPLQNKLPDKRDDITDFLWKMTNHYDGNYSGDSVNFVKEKDVDQYVVPVIFNKGNKRYGTVDYDYLINKIVDDNDFKSLCLSFHHVAKSFNDWLYTLNKILNNPFENIEFLDLQKLCMKLILNYKYQMDASIFQRIDILCNYYMNNTSWSLRYLSTLIKYVNYFVSTLKDIDFKVEFNYLSLSLINIIENMNYFKFKSNQNILHIFMLNHLQGILRLKTLNYDALIAAKTLREIVESRKLYLRKKLLDISESVNKRIIILKPFHLSDFDTFKEEGSIDETLVIYKYPDNTFSVIRTSPNMNDYICESSIRKVIRDLFKGNKNVFYKDNIINHPYNLRIGDFYNEKTPEIDLKKDTNYEELSSKYQLISPLKGVDRIGDSWTMYATMILILNHDKSLSSIGNYLGSFFLKSDYIQRYNPLYTLYKHIKLYRSMILVICFLYRTFGEDRFKSIFLEELIIYGATKKDTQLLESIVKDLLPQFNEFDTILKDLNKNPVPKQNIEGIDPDKCTDNLFNHNEMCQMDDITKTITEKEKEEFNCNNTNITLIGTKQAEINRIKGFDAIYEKKKQILLSQNSS
jgi:hypothetical protein